ncbi:MAG: SCO family protein, partial [Gammaproteobacteria bacterium]|nr:SCO family protein [Gammaproteobacteria bacterium]
MKRGALIGLILLLAAASVWLGIYWQPEGTVSSEIAPAPQGGDFVLASAAGPVELAAMRGKVVVLFFGYTTCPDVCPTSLAILSMALNGLSEGEVEQVQGVFVSVDPERDSLEHLQEYGRYFH